MTHKRRTGPTPSREAGPESVERAADLWNVPLDAGDLWPRDLGGSGVFRVAQLREAGHRLLTGAPVEPGWIVIQLWDFADLLEVNHLG